MPRERLPRRSVSLRPKSELEPNNDTKIDDAQEPVEEPLEGEALEKLKIHVKKITTLFDLKETDWNERCESVIETFLKDNSIFLLTIYFDESVLKASLGFPSCRFTDIHYFGRKKYGVNLSKENFHELVTWGTLNANAEQSIYAYVAAVREPMTVALRDTPKTVKTKFAEEMNQFLEAAAELRYDMLQTTGLYISPEGSDMTPLEASKNSSLVKRLNALLLEWYTSINSAIEHNESYLPSDDPEPMDVFDFWKHRYQNLCGIWQQLETPQLGHICRILVHAQSQYVAKFFALIKRLKVEREIALSNAKHLQQLEEPSFALSDVRQLEDVASFVPKILFIFRHIWMRSPHFNTDEHLHRMCSAFSNQIVNICRFFFELDFIFKGNPNAGIDLFRDILSCLDDYVTLFEKAVAIHNENNKRKWNLDRENVFCTVDILRIRCSDMLEVCNSMKYFGRISESDEIRKPKFGWTRARDFNNAIDQVEALYGVCFNELSNVQDSLIDLHSNSWAQTMQKFREGLREIEVIIENLLGSVFEVVTNVEEGLEALQELYQYSQRPQLYSTFERYTINVLKMFLRELNSAKKEMTSEKHSHLRTTPRYGGRAMVAFQKRSRLESLFTMLKEAEWLPETAIEIEVRHEYHALRKDLTQTIESLYLKWLSSVPSSFDQRNYRPLLAEASTPNLIAVNIDKGILDMAEECRFWMQLHKKIPNHVINYFNTRYDDLSIRYKRVQNLVNQHNKIILSLSNCEKLLFKEHLYYLKRQMGPGFSPNLHWENDMSQLFIEESTGFVVTIGEFVEDYKNCNLKIRKECEEIAQTLLVSIPSGSEFDLNELQEHFREGRSQAVFTISENYKAIFQYILVVYDGFSGLMKHIRPYWYKYLEELDILLEHAIILSVKKTLKHLQSRLKKKDGAEPEFFVKVKADLKNKKIIFRPKLLELGNLIQSSFTDFILCLNVFPRLFERFSINLEIRLPPYAAMVAADRECQKLNYELGKEISAAFTEIHKFVQDWHKYRDIWETDKDIFLLRYEKRNPTSEVFAVDINKYFMYSEEISDIEASSKIHFFHVDASDLKDKIIQHCTVWQKRLTILLMKSTNILVEGVYRYCHQLAKRVNEPPKVLHELPEALRLYKELVRDQDKQEDKIPVIHEQLNILLWFKDDTPMTMTDRAHGMWQRWKEYLDELDAAKEMLDVKQTVFKDALVAEANQFRSEILALQKKYQDFAPTSATMESKDALQWINDYVRELKISRSKDDALISDFSIFEIDHPPSELLRALEKEVGALSIVWLLANQWDRTYDVYKTSQFSLLDTVEMEMFAQEMYKKFTMLMKELREKNWPCVEQLRRQVELFRRVLPLINDLKNKSMQKRHWDGIRALVHHDFDEKSENFNLELILEMHMLKHAEGISEISNAATMELAIENNLKMIQAAWKVIELDMVPYKDRGIFRIKGVDDIFTSLEEHQTILSAMKGTRYVQPFISDVEYWEKNLTLVLEVLEHALIVQRNFLYLENIFIGEDIRKQLPREADVFDKIIREWRNVTRNMNTARKAFVAAQHPGIIKIMKKLIAALESIQKSLEKYLETKRHVFPRFYFISNDDLLDILGNSKRPDNIQPHFKKLFDNINKLKMQKHPVYNRMDAHGMFSIDGEYIDFNKFLALEGPVEIWLCGVEKLMRSTLKDHLKLVRVALKKNLSRRDKWIKEHPGQLCITSSQIQWTLNCTRALLQCKGLGRRAPMKRLRKKENQALAKFSEAVRSNLTKIQRLKIVALVTVEIHARDVIEKMYRTNTTDVQAFEWLSQLRFYWDKDVDDCIVRQTNTQFLYGYEYLGNSGRLVITPLTDRCYITLTTALHLYRGGSPKGPAGTGKTETVKDLGKALAYYVIVINCSEGLDYKSMGRMFSGFAQSGAWGCFDEFNRINIEVLSVVAQQILSILRALQAKKTYFSFEGVVIQLIPTCGIFITMNPGYAGRTELPDNLKSMFRPISMMVPDSMLIAEITLFGEGFRDTRVLAKKVFTLFSLAKQQLSKQNHYDFGLRGMVALLRYAGKKRRQLSHLPDEEVVLLAMKDMNIAKLTSDDFPLFNGIIRDLFPGVDIPVIDYEVLYKAIREELKKSLLQDIQIALTKVIQLYETKGSRHSVVILGATGSAKSTTWKLLKNSLTSLKKQGVAGYESAQEYVINPKALNLAEIYGEFNLATNEWSDGVLSSIMRRTCADENPDEKWILFDGPVDAVWIENMNSVMDDNKVLTLINSERITMPEQVSLLFEVEDLAEASPATVSRCGIVFNDYKDFGWQPFVQSWLLKQTNAVYKSCMSDFFEKFTDDMLNFKRHECVETVKVPEICCVITLCKLLDCVAPPENCYGKDKTDETTIRYTAKLWFLFCLTWSIGASVNEDGRLLVDQFLRGLESDVWPQADTVYEYFVSQKSKSMVHWESQLASNWRYNAELPFFKIIVPTVDTVRYDFITSVLIQAGYPILIVGVVGTGKTSTAINFLETIDSNKYTTLCLNMSAQTTSNMIQDVIENRVEKRTKTIFVPIGGKKMITFMDDFNMPAKEKYGAQPPLELIRQWIDYGFWYNRSNQTIVAIRDMLIMAAMGPPGGGRNSISNRLVSKFSVLNITFPTDPQIKRIFLTMFNQHVDDFPVDVKAITTRITEVTLALYKKVVIKMLPTPTKTHYLFNLRDISKVFQGLLRSSRETSGTKTNLLKLWAHESFRIFYDRLNDDQDRSWFSNQIEGVLKENFDLILEDLWGKDQLAVFCEFTNTYNQYEFVSDLKMLREHIGSEMEEYNNSPGNIKLDLVLFQVAVETICHLARIVSQPRGHVLIASIGGGGRQCLARVAAWLCGCSTFKVEISRNYKLNEFREDLKRVYHTAGVKDSPIVFLFTDAQITDEGFLELINNILSTGEVAKLYRPEEFEEIRNILWETAKKSGIVGTHEALYNYFLDRARSNLHMAICMSPVGDMFRARLRQYPALVSCTTIKWLFDWPSYALIEVALRQLRDVDMLISSTNTYPEGLQEEEIRALQAKTRNAVALTFATVHQSVQRQSKNMLKELKRHNYVTPVNYLELVAGYKKMLSAKRIEVSTSANKLRNGLFKIDETKEKVYELTLELEEKNKLVTQTTMECDEYMIEILSQKREADLAQKAVLQRSEVIALEEKECQEMAESALADLQEAMPALEAAMKALEALNKKDVAEVRSYGKPPVKVEMVLEAVMILKGKEPNWEEAKRELGDVNFLNKLKNFDKDHISDKTLRKVANYTKLEDFEPEKVGQVSTAAKSLAMWVIAIEKYGKAWRIVAPRKAKLDEAMGALAQARAKLKQMKDKMEELQRLVQKLEEEYAVKLKEKDELIKQAENLKLKLERAAGLVEGLSGERGRWEQTVFNLDKNFVFLPNDCLLATAFVSYCGPFLSSYREDLVTEWNQVLADQSLDCTPGFGIKDFLERPHVIRLWNKMGLPADDFSSENGIIVTQSAKWPLVIDPQAQAWKWIKKKEVSEANRSLKIVDFGTHEYMNIVERAMRKGQTVLLQNVGETLEPNILPVLNKIIIKKGTNTYIKIADKLLDYNNDFRFYITTKLSNPHYLPEIATRTTVVNFAIKEEGLEEQLLGIVVGKEKPKLEETKDTMVMEIANGKKLLIELEDELLRLLTESKGSLLDDDELFHTLQTSRETAINVNEQLIQSIETEKAIDVAREAYRPCATRSSILFFVLKDLANIDPMYQFSLDSYIDLFEMSIKRSKRSENVYERIIILNEFHTYAVYKNTCRGLFERHKLLFSFMICIKVLEHSGQVKKSDYNFLLKGGVVLNRDGQEKNPVKAWLPDEYWDNITELDKLDGYEGIAASFEASGDLWKAWYMGTSPETTPLIDDWDARVDHFQFVVILRSIRPDRLSFAMAGYISKTIGKHFIEPPVLDVTSVLEESSPKTPLIFVLSPGVDPVGTLTTLAEAANMGKKFRSLSLGQGQAPIATRLIREGVTLGHWVFLANCHLSLSWMPALDKIIETLQGNEDVQPDFRLWLSSNPHPDFPISILQNSLKMTTEPPKGLKPNMIRLYNVITDDKLDACKAQEKFRKLVFSLCWFHSILLERKKFQQLGWNVIYSFNDSDFEVSLSILSIYLDEYEATPWDALKYLIAGVCYGGHVTDDWDRRLLMTYVHNYFNDDAISVENYKVSSLPDYYIPKDGSLQTYKDYVANFPNVDEPEAFGQHPNADIASLIVEARYVMENLMLLQIQDSADDSMKEDLVVELTDDVLSKLPSVLDYEAVNMRLGQFKSPLSVVLLQEISRYNVLLYTISDSLKNLKKGIQGFVVMSSDLEMIFNCIFEGRVPPLWLKAYPSLLSLGSWTRDLIQRVDHFTTWANSLRPPVNFWLSAFTFPTGFLTAVLQTAARREGISVDLLSWEFTPKGDVHSSLVPPEEGVLIKGMYLEGASWNSQDNCLCEPKLMELVTMLPVIQFRPVEQTKRKLRGYYNCPCYYYPQRSGDQGREAFIVAVDLKSGEVPSEYWIKRGAAILLSLSN